MAEEMKELEELEGNVGNAAELLDSSVTVDTFEQVLGKDLVIKAVDERASLFSEGTGKYFTVTAEVKKGKGNKGKKETVGFNTGSEVLIKQLSQLEGHLPVHATIEKVKARSGYCYYQIQQG
jgi:hypothetical protein